MTYRIRLAMLLLSVLWVVGCKIGGTNAVSTAVHDGQIVLVRKGTSSYGALIPTNQRMNRESLGFTWYYRRDGKGTFRPSDSGHYRSGSGVSVSDSSVPYLMARFGPFSIGWSGYQDGEGHLYYPHFEGEAVSPNDVRICVTTETDIERIDATDPKWLYKGSPTDPGIHGGGKRP